jgi:hypothetical protein
MFGMLDYRAHKLYIILFCIPLLIVHIFTIFGLPIINYAIGLQLFDERIFQIISSLVSACIVGIIWSFFIFGVVSKLFQFLFTLFVDVIPHDGRTKEEAQAVVWNGDKAILLLEGGKHPNKWRENFEEEIAKLDWVQSLFFKDRIIERLRRIKENFEFDDEEAELAYNPYKLENFIIENNLEPTWFEKFICNKLYRRYVVGWLFFIYLLAFDPFS